MTTTRGVASSSGPVLLLDGSWCLGPVVGLSMLTVRPEHVTRLTARATSAVRTF